MPLPARKNPFAADRIERLLAFDPQWIDLSWDQIFDRAGRINWRGAILGPHGSGKTTFLDAFAQRIEERGPSPVRWFLNDGMPPPRAADVKLENQVSQPERAVLLIDGGEFFGRNVWRKVVEQTESFHGVFITGHQLNRLPWPRFPVFLETRTRPEMLRAFAEELAPDHGWSTGALKEIFDRHRGNLREALWECYDRTAENGGVSRPVDSPA